MKKLLILVAVLAVACAKSFETGWSQTQPIESIAVNSSQVRPIEDSNEYWDRVPAEMQYLRMPQPDRRIVGGTPARDTEGSFFALLEIERGTSKSECGGSILTSNLILTAARCVRNAERGFAIVGSLNRKIEEPTRQRISFGTIYFHADFTETNWRNNIAIVRLSSHIAFNNRIQTVWLPSRGDNRLFAGDEGFVYGFGRTCTNCGPSDVLLYARNPILTNAACSNIWTTPNLIQDQNICMSSEGGRNFCTDDFGGPVVINENNQALQVGIASFLDANGCESGHPTVSTRVTTFLPWILHVVSM